jgi:hypothetical protein
VQELTLERGIELDSFETRGTSKLNAPCSLAQQELASQRASLEPVCKRIFSERISTRIKTRRELEKVLKLAYDLYRALAEAEEAAASDGVQVFGPRPIGSRITGPGIGTDPELMERLTAQVLDGDTVLDDLACRTEDGSDDVVAQLLAQARNGDNQ